MASIAVDSRLDRTLRFYDSANGKKVVMAATGVALFGFVIAHLLGNLQVYFGPGKLDEYGRLLHQNPGLLWTIRGFLLGTAVLHITAATQLYLLKKRARPVGYAKKIPTTSTYASRTMYWSGPILLAFIVYHLLHFTTGTVLPGFKEGAVHENLVRGFSNPLVSGFYILAMVLLCTHLYHGIWSMLQTVGFGHPRYAPKMKTFAKAAAIALAAGNISIPVSVLLGIIR